MSTEQNTPENPYPIDVFTMTMEQYVKAVPDGKLRTAISGCVGRHVWDVCCKQWLEQLRVAQLENTAPCDYCDPAGYVHHNKYCPKHPRNNQPMSTEPNAAKFNEPIWDSRNSDEPRQPPPETIDEYCGQPPGSFKQFVRYCPNFDFGRENPSERQYCSGLPACLRSPKCQHNSHSVIQPFSRPFLGGIS